VSSRAFFPGAAFPKKNENNCCNTTKLWYSAEVRACSLTCCRPRGRDFPGPATGNRRRDVRGAGHIAPARFGAISPCALRLQRPASATGGAFHVFWVASPDLNPNLFTWIKTKLRSPSQPQPQKTTGLAPNRTKSHQIAPKKFCAWQKRASSGHSGATLAAIVSPPQLGGPVVTLAGATVGPSGSEVATNPDNSGKCSEWSWKRHRAGSLRRTARPGGRRLRNQHEPTRGQRRMASNC
jgi:hypothetical protein